MSIRIWIFYFLCIFILMIQSASLTGSRMDTYRGVSVGCWGKVMVWPFIHLLDLFESLTGSRYFLFHCSLVFILIRTLVLPRFRPWGFRFDKDSSFGHLYIQGGEFMYVFSSSFVTLSFVYGLRPLLFGTFGSWLVFFLDFV